MRITTHPDDPLFIRILNADILLMAQGKRVPHCGEPDNSTDGVEWAAAYAEPGYDTPKAGILLANWNHFSREVGDILEHFGYALEWSDEWATCDSCYRIVRTSPDSYSWRRSYWMDDGDCQIICRDCLDEAAYVDSYLLNNPHHADVLDVDLASLGFTRFNADHYENGWHRGQDDTPADVVKHLPPGVDYVFQIPEVSQFYLLFDVWTRPRAMEASE